MTENKYLADGPLVVAIDSSTTSTKAIVVDAEGNIWHTAKQNIQLHTPAMDQYEHNPIRCGKPAAPPSGRCSPSSRRRTAAASQPSASPTSANHSPPSIRTADRSETASCGSTDAPQSKSAATAANTSTSSPESQPASPPPSTRWPGLRNTNPRSSLTPTR